MEPTAPRAKETTPPPRPFVPRIRTLSGPVADKQRAKCRAYYVAHREELLAKQRARDAIRKRSPESMAKKRIAFRVWAAANVEHRRKYRRDYTKKNRAKIAAQRNARRAAHRGTERDYGRAYYAKNREKIRRQATAWRRAHPSSTRKYTLKRGYGLSVEDFARMVAAQGGLCAICKKPPVGRGNDAILHIDHCHATGKIRALLCSLCNRGLGLFRDDPARMDSAAAYIRSHARTDEERRTDHCQRAAQCHAAVSGS